ncbi:hypothetical protein KP509_19G014700 [Ceratopteris richardii]|uniref:3'-5' exonuclease domain-containing protein n=1 Tax=Ceratopteris richardii TaxID=49495 RepID=A0A8T2SI05_CERRI|nr:hypothetical protein KP509_19G014700 [Ceratopteris richardii]
MDVKRKVMVVGCVTTAVAILLLYHASLGRRRRRRIRISGSIGDAKPQRNFKVLLADNSLCPFIHLSSSSNAEAGISHPYHEEISLLLENLGELPRVADIEQGPPPMTDDFIWIDTKDGLEEVARILSKEVEFGVDTEQHSIRSFLGITALLQVSTRKQDFLIDTIALHDEMGVLRNVFANPFIRKVFHGADSDTLWLQRDFHIYVVNLFDTAKACEVLGKRPRSLAFLLEHYCGVITNKIYQLADWRLRPLPEEMLLYARTDAHYLLYIADCLQNELLQGGSVCQNSMYTVSMYGECVRRSNILCLQLYEKDSTPPESLAASLFTRYSGSLGFSLDTLEARSSDESPRFVLSDRAMLAIAESNPSDVNSILQCVSGVSDVSSALDEAPYMTPLPSPSPVLLEHIDSLKNVLDQVNTWNVQGIIDTYSLKLSECVKDQNSMHLHQHTRTRKLRDYEAFRKKFVQKFSCKGPVYQNCRIYAGDGGLLCFCDRKKLDWYVQRGLAEFLDEDPPAIRLLFEPKRRPEDENNDFYLQSKTNRCVGCGETSHYLRYRVIPSCYRQYFPQHLKSHRSHDIVLLCVDCHEVAHRAAEKHKKQVAEEYGVPLFAKRVVDSGVLSGNGSEAQVVDVTVGGVSPRPLRTAAVALLRYGSDMPKERREELEAVVQAYYGGRAISHADIAAAALVGRGLKDSSRRQKKKGLGGDKVRQMIEVEYSENNLYQNDVEVVGGKEKYQKGEGDVQGPKEIVLSNGNLMLNGIESVKTVTEKCIRVQKSGVEESFDGEYAIEPNIGCFDDLDDMVLETVAATTSEDAEERQKPLDIIVDKDLVMSSGNGNLNDEIQLKNQEQELSSSSQVRKQRVSLLGHGPHGKKVVEMILEREGEDGINRFCRIWRSVFVDALQPTHLPAGWNILHSGYREFGKYSIYNPNRDQTSESNERILEHEGNGEVLAAGSNDDFLA